ncbi:regulatory protein TetR [Actinobacteria bacterium OK074]|nr:regulatory protein TetR [Actinobacteria bacterium OK074]
MTTTLRERKKAATREALHAAAVRLAVRNGVESLTVEAIADAATVSRRTFSNYFASKEQALLHRERTRVAMLAELIRAVPAGETLRTALVRAVEQLITEHAAHPEQDAQYWELRLHPALLPELVATYAAVEQDLTEAIAGRLPAEPAGALRAQVLAAAFLAVLRVLGQRILDRGERDARNLVDQAAGAVLDEFR